jgi:hypothetical protein
MILLEQFHYLHIYFLNKSVIIYIFILNIFVKIRIFFVKFNTFPESQVVPSATLPPPLKGAQDGLFLLAHQIELHIKSDCDFI